MRKTKLLYKVWVLSFSLLFLAKSLSAQYNPYDIATASGNYNFSYTQVPGNLIPVDAAKTGTAYQWESSPTPLFDGTPIILATTASYNVSTILQQTTWYRRRITIAGGAMIYSNIIKLQVVSQKWEDINYVREHDILVTGQTDWKVIDQMAIGSKLQTTTYLDGLGRPLEKVSRETSVPPSGTLWGDVVQFSKYDIFGREPQQYLPYTIVNTTESGKYKMAPLTDQALYYTSAYGETPAYSQATYDNSPLNRVINVKAPGTAWAAGAGNSEVYELNEPADNVQIFTIGYTAGDYPTSLGAYPANSLLKTKHLDEYGKQVIEYTNKSGQLILTKTQIAATPSAAHLGWICVYSVYDDFGLLRYRIQPEAVNYLDANGWTFTGTNGQKVLDGLCFRYDYDSKGRNTLKKAPGAKALNMMYDSRDRIVFMQDGNQAAKTPNAEWTANLYDDLDRLIITTLYRPAKTQAQLQTDINNAVSNSVSIVNANQPVTNLVVDNRVTTITTYSATNTIEFVPGFISGASDAFVAQIDANAAQTTTVTTATYTNPITNTELNNTTLNTIIKYLFYDGYSYAGAKSFDNNFDNTSAYPNSDPNVIPIVTSQRTLSFPTGSMVRVLGTNTFLTSTEFYDEKGRHIQSIEDNFKSGKDVTTLQYHWDGRLLSSHTKHTTAGSGYANFSILTKNTFDKIGRVTSIMKKYGANAFKTIASYDLDDMGRLKTKHLDPGYAGSGKTEMESLSYTYNIQNNITGINKDYALKTAGKYDKWGNFFGLYLGYDNRDLVFNAAKLDGHVTGLLWNTQGDDNQRKYDYTYDDAGRLTKADFREKKTPGDVWDNSKMDFTVGGSGAGSTIEYDLNGNLLSMLQKGVVPGGAATVTIDDLHYSYASYSNKLTKVTDNSTLGTTNGMFGDFKDGTNGADDYVYDDNGNLVLDLNKGSINASGGLSTPLGVGGITYNFLDKPEQINITGKGTINIVYDADGNKLQKKYTPAGSSTTNTTTYVNEFVYQGTSISGAVPNETVSYINFEEGRIRVVTPVSSSNGFDGLTIDGNMDLPNNKRGAYDFFIRDYQQNVRMIVTEETHTGINQCTMESSRAANEQPVFGQADPNNEVSQTRFAISGIPGQGSGGGWASNTSSSVSKLGALTKKAGPNVLLKVMAGDQINATAQYYYQNPVTNGTGNTLTTNIVAALIQSILGSPATGLAKGNTANISTQLNADPNFISKTAPDASNSAGPNPKAYLTIVFFDERFNYVAENSTTVRVSQPGDGATPLVLPANIKAPKNGFAYVYLSNESSEPVYFDNFIVSDNRGRIIEEDHYYAYGLKIAGISSKKLPDPNEGTIDNKNFYNDKELFDEADLDWYDYGFRSYDPQTGRFTQLDPLTDGYPHYTPFQYAGNEPIANVDLDGLEEFQSLTPIVVQGLIKTAPAATNVGLSIFKISTAVIPSVSTLVVNHTEETSINRQLQANIQSNLSTPAVGQATTVGPCCNYSVSDEQKSINADKTNDAGYNPDGTLKSWAILAQNRTWNNFANNIVFSPAADVAGLAVGVGELREGFRIMKIGEDASLGFKSFSSFKRTFGPAGKGQAWHHIVEQAKTNITKFGAESIHSTENIIKIEHGGGTIHAKVSAYYSSKQPFTGGKTVRQWLSRKSFQEQYDFGIKTLIKFGWKP